MISLASRRLYWQNKIPLTAYEKGHPFLAGMVAIAAGSPRMFESGSHSSRTMTIFRPWNFCLLGIRAGGHKAFAEVTAEFHRR
jgi:hypothetical protein